VRPSDRPLEDQHARPVPARLLLAALVCLAALQTTLAGVDGDSLLSTLPAIVKDLERIDTAWTALDQRIEQTCG
jgi:hypothetical protein